MNNIVYLGLVLIVLMVIIYYSSNFIWEKFSTKLEEYEFDSKTLDSSIKGKKCLVISYNYTFRDSSFSARRAIYIPETSNPTSFIKKMEVWVLSSYPSISRVHSPEINKIRKQTSFKAIYLMVAIYGVIFVLTIFENHL